MSHLQWRAVIKWVTGDHCSTAHWPVQTYAPNSTWPCHEAPSFPFSMQPKATLPILLCKSKEEDSQVSNLLINVTAKSGKPDCTHEGKCRALQAHLALFKQAVIHDYFRCSWAHSLLHTFNTRVLMMHYTLPTSYLASIVMTFHISREEREAFHTAVGRRRTTRNKLLPRPGAELKHCGSSSFWHKSRSRAARRWGLRFPPLPLSARQRPRRAAREAQPSSPTYAGAARPCSRHELSTGQPAGGRPRALTAHAGRPRLLPTRCLRRVPAALLRGALRDGGAAGGTAGCPRALPRSGKGRPHLRSRRSAALPPRRAALTLAAILATAPQPRTASGKGRALGRGLLPSGAELHWGWDDGNRTETLPRSLGGRGSLCCRVWLRPVLQTLRGERPAALLRSCSQPGLGLLFVITVIREHALKQREHKV